MVLAKRRDDEPADQRGVVLEEPIAEPVDEPGDEVGDEIAGQERDDEDRGGGEAVHARRDPRDESRDAEDGERQRRGLERLLGPWTPGSGGHERSHSATRANVSRFRGDIG